jgi:hypothetical protein
VAALVQTVGDWGGIHLDFGKKTSCLAAKTLDKTEVSWSRRTSWTWRTFYAHIGLLFWAWQLIDLPMAEFYPLLRFIGAASAMLTQNEQLWDTPATVWSSAWPALERWTMLVLRNAPRVVPQAAPPEWLVATDASRWGWGYVAVQNVTGAVRAHGAPWSAKFRQLYGDRLGVSTFTEPQAVYNALCHLLDPAVPVRVRVLTDNTVTQASYARGYNAHSFHINECLRLLQKTFGEGFIFEFAYLPGECNLADSRSRGVIAESKEERDRLQLMSAELRRIAGTASWSPRELEVAARTSLLARPTAPTPAPASTA